MNQISKFCAAFGIVPEEFRDMLERTTALAGELAPQRLEDLALAQGCARGNDAAWECFAARFGGRLQALALSITGEESSARELAGSLYSDLFGSKKLLSYSGRGSLEGWLRAVMAQQHVNQIRSARRITSYEAIVESGGQFSAAAEDLRLSDSRLDASVDAALAALNPDERFLLASYYLDGRTLAQIGCVLGIHESTVSRRMEKVVGLLRKRTLRELRKRGVPRLAAEEMLGSDVRDVEVDVGRRLMGARK